MADCCQNNVRVGYRSKELIKERDMKTMLVIFFAVFSASILAETESVKPFSAVCTDKHVAAYRYALDIEGKEVKGNGWSSGEKFISGEWKILYSGGKYVTLDGKKIPIVARAGANLIFAKPGIALFGADIWSYAVNLKLKKVVAAQVHSFDGLGDGIKTRSIELKCKFVIH